jgi:hypothetical protein
MRFIKLAPIVGVCVVSFFPLSATAQQWVMNCESNLCLDITEPGGPVQMQPCDEGLVGQQWDARQPLPENIQNRFNGQCLDFNIANGMVATNACNPGYMAQLWDYRQDWFPNPIRNMYTGQCLDAAGGNVVSAPCNASPTQMWKWVNIGDNAPGCPPH